MKRLLRGLAVAAVAAFSLVASAADPLVLWDKDIGTAKDGWKSDAQGNTVAGGILTVDQPRGVVFSNTSATLSDSTVIIRSSGLDLESKTNQYLFTAWRKGAAGDIKQYGANWIGCCLTPSNGMVKGVALNEAWTGAGTYSPLTGGGKCLVVNVQPSGGLYVYEMLSDAEGNRTLVQVMSAPGLKYSTSAYQGFTLGGVNTNGAQTVASSSSLLPAAGWTIEKVALFNATLSESEILNYRFPSEVFVATMDADAKFSELGWIPEKPAGGFGPGDGVTVENTKPVTLTLDEPIGKAPLKIVNAAGNPLTIDMADQTFIGTCDFTGAAGGIVIDARGLDMRAAERSTAAGAPYSHWLVKVPSPTSADISVRAPNVTDGYKVVAETVPGVGVRLVVTAPTSARFGAVSVNLHNGTELTGDGYHGLHPYLRADWANLRVANGETVTHGGLAFTLSDSVTAYALNNDPPDAIQKQYMDDATAERTITVSNMVAKGYAKYRAIVYFSTDTANVNFAPMSVTANGETTWYAGPTAGDVAGGATVKGRNAAWGHTGPNHNANALGEGVNALVTDVLTADTVVLGFTKLSASGRATPCAVQIVKVGEIVEGGIEYSAEITSAGTNVLWDLNWFPKPFSPSANASVKITISPTVSGEVVLDVGAAFAIDRFTVVSKGDATLWMIGSNPSAVNLWNLFEAKGRMTFGFPFDANKVLRGEYPRLGVGYTYEGEIRGGFEYLGTNNVLYAADIRGASTYAGGTGTLTNGLAGSTGLFDVYDGGELVFTGKYGHGGNVGLGATLGTLTIAKGAEVTVPHVRILNTSAAANDARVTVAGRLVVDSECGSNCYADRINFRGILFGHWTGASSLVVTGELVGEGTWLQDAYTAAACPITVDGGLLKVRGINFAKQGATLSVTNGGTVALADGLANPNNAAYSFDDATLSAYAYADSTGYAWSPSSTRISGTFTADPNGQAIAVSGAIIGSGSVDVFDSSAAGDGELAVNYSNAYEGRTDIRKGMVKIGRVDALSTNDVVIAPGGALDLYGKCPANRITASGSGVKGSGAILNTGAALSASSAPYLTLAGDTTLGGTARIFFGTSSYLDLAGHTLTVSGSGNLAIALAQVLGGGAIDVELGTFTPSGTTRLDDIDLSVRSRGTLDLSAGTALSCRDFASSGYVYGNAATLTVAGRFDANATVQVAKLTLADGATLAGKGLKVTDKFAYGPRISVEGTHGVNVALAPTTTDTSGKFVLYEGRLGYTLRMKGTQLMAERLTDNWLTYADERGVRREGDRLIVTNEFGLAWIAASSTNGWFRGNVELGADLDLSELNWTPVVQFSGTFDGKGYVISGLNNTNVVAGWSDAGRYPGGVTNDWGTSAYGLFGTATNAVFRDVTFEGVAIDDGASAVAPLLGMHMGGGLSVSNVRFGSGSLLGTGGSVAGIVGAVNGWDALSVVNNTNDVTDVAAGSAAGAPRWAAGILTVGGAGNPDGAFVVTGNVVRCTVGNTIWNNEDGGNVAQVLAGTTWGTQFGAVVVTNNVAEGGFDVTWENHHGHTFDLPVCNLAAAVMRFDPTDGYSRFVEANDPKSIPVDPLDRTARMLSGEDQNGSDSIAGWWRDELTAIPAGGEIEIEGTGNTLDFWETVYIDRDVTIDLKGNCVYGLYDCDVFVVADGVTVTLKNGVVYYAHGYLPYSGGTVQLDNVKVAEIPGDTFYDRTVPIGDLEVREEFVSVVIPYTSEDFYYCVDSTPTLAQDWMLNAASERGNGSTLTLQVRAAGEAGFYRVRITDVAPAEP